MNDRHDPLDRLATLTLPEPDAARMQADIARARARFVEAGQQMHPAGGGFLARLRARFLPGGLTFAGGLVAAGLAAVVILPMQLRQTPGPLVAPDADGAAPAAIAERTASAQAADEAPYGGVSASSVDPRDLASAPAAAAPAPPVAEVTLPEPTAPTAEFAEADLAQPAPAPGARSSLVPPSPAAPGAAAGTDALLASGAERTPSTTLPRIGPRPRLSATELSQVRLELPSENAIFSGSASFTVAGDTEGVWLERDNGRLTIPLDATTPGLSLDMTDMFLLPERRELPAFLVMMGELDGTRAWQIFRVGKDQITYDRVLTTLQKDAVTPGQVEGMLAQLPPTY